VNTVQIKLDYKPKKVDYAGLRSGHTTEFMNFFILDGADIILRHVILYGVASFDKLHQTLNDVWMPDVKNNQLPGVLAGLAPIRSIVNVGSGVRDLVVVPMREYKKDGRIVRSVQKGALAFAKTTTSELARFGAKLAIGTQTVLEGAEAFLSPQSASAGLSSADSWEDLDPSSSPSLDEPRAISHYANQPIGVMAGLRGAARHLERDLLTARDAVIAIPGEVMESGSAGGAAKAVIRRAPTVILKPALGATKAVSNALFGVSNALDSQSRRKMEDVSLLAICEFPFVGFIANDVPRNTRAIEIAHALYKILLAFLVSTQGDSTFWFLFFPLYMHFHSPSSEGLFPSSNCIAMVQGAGT
jgi:autophagy-related protein 2